MNLTEARTALGDRGFDYLSSASMDLMLNRALTELEDYWSWPWLHKTATGPAPLTISDLKQVLAVRDSNGSELMGVDDRENVDFLETGTPSSWWIDDSTGTSVMRTWPVGDVTLNVRYIAEISTLSGATDTPNIPSRFAHLWIDLAVVRAYQDSDNFAAAQALRQDVEGSLQRMVERYETRDRQTSQVMVQRTWSLDE